MDSFERIETEHTIWINEELSSSPALYTIEECPASPAVETTNQTCKNNN